jgi:PQQ-dependent catabolism-associated CXXCW motif protein
MGGVMVAVTLLLSMIPIRAEAVVPEPSSYRTDDYNKPVPKTLAGVAAVVDADAAKALMTVGDAIFIDVYPRPPKPPNLPSTTIWREPPHRSIKGAKWVPNVGFGALSPVTQAFFENQLVRLTDGRRDKPLVIFCLRDCWMSWNAAKRAISLGYTKVFWFSEGTDAWEESGYDLTVVEPVPP